MVVFGDAVAAVDVVEVVDLAAAADLAAAWVHSRWLLVPRGMFDFRVTWAGFEEALVSLDMSQLLGKKDWPLAYRIQKSRGHTIILANLRFLTLSSVSVQFPGKGPKSTA